MSFVRFASVCLLVASVGLGQNITTPPPSSTPVPGVPVWTVSDDKGGVCIMLALDADLIIYYNTTTSLLNSTLTIPADAKSSGSCNDSTMILTFTQPARGAQFVFNVTFEQSGSTYKLGSLQLTYVLSNVTFPGVKDINSTVTASLTEVPSFLQDIPVGSSVKCAVNKKLLLGEDVVVKVQEVQLQAFMEGKEFGKAMDCVPQTNRNIVPIAVGCALALLAIIVLAAYLIGRRRSRRGYQSV